MRRRVGIQWISTRSRFFVTKNIVTTFLHTFIPYFFFYSIEETEVTIKQEFDDSLDIKETFGEESDHNTEAAQKFPTLCNVLKRHKRETAEPNARPTEPNARPQQDDKSNSSSPIMVKSQNSVKLNILRRPNILKKPSVGQQPSNRQQTSDMLRFCNDAKPSDSPEPNLSSQPNSSQQPNSVQHPSGSQQDTWTPESLEAEVKLEIRNSGECFCL